MLRKKGGYPVEEAIPLAEEITEKGMFAQIPMEPSKTIRLLPDPEPTNE